MAGPTLDLGNLLVHLNMDAAQYFAMMKSVEARMRRTSAKLTAIGRQMTLRITAPIVAMGFAATKAFASFDDAMTKSLAIMKGITPELRQEMENLALEISTQGVTSAKDLARSYFFLASAGLTAEQSMASLGVVERFAVAGAFDMALATDLATDAQSALGLTVKNARQNMINMTRVTDVLTGANTLANASTEQFSLALTSQAGPAMKAYNIELEEGVAVLAAYADQGIKAQVAGNMLSRMLRLMTKGFKDHRGAWAQYNIDIFDTTGELKPLYTIIGDLSNVLGVMSTEQKIAALGLLGFQARSQQAILPLLGLQDRIKEYNEELLKMSGITKEIADKQLKSFTSQMIKLKNQIFKVGIEIGRMLAPTILRLNGVIKRAIDFWDSMEDSTKRNVLIYVALAAAIGPVLLATGLLLKTFTFMIATVNTLTASLVGLTTALFGPIGVALLLVAIAYTLRAAWVQNLEAIKDRMKDFFNSLKEGFDWLANIVIGKFLVWMGKAFVDAFKTIGKGWKEFIGNIAGGAAGAWAYLRNIHRGLTAAADAWAKAYMKAFDTIEGKMKTFEKVTVDTFKTTVIGLKAFGEVTIEHLSELMGALKTQFGEDADAIIALIKSKMLQLKVPAGETPLGLSPGDVAEITTGMKRLTKQHKEYNRELERMKTPMQEWSNNVMEVQQRVGEVFASTFERMGDVLATFLVEGKANFRDFAKSVIKDLLAIYIRYQVIQPIAMGLGFMPASAAGVPAGDMNPAMASIAHAGGIVGSSTWPTRTVPAATFIGAPRLHSGLASDEFPTILQRGETVIPKGGGVAVPTIIINNNTGQQFKQDGAPKFNGREWVIGIVTEEITQFGSLRHTIQGIGQSG